MIRKKNPNLQKTKMLRDPENISYEDFKELVERINSYRNKALVCFLYATGARVSEANKVRRKDISIQQINGKDYIIFRVPSLKKKGDKKYSKETDKGSHRQILVRLDEDWLSTPIMDFVTSFQPDSRLFPYHRATIYKLVWEAIEINPHGFRKLRLTHLATKHKFTDQQLTKFAGWEDSRPSKAYVKLNLEDIAY